MADMVVNLNHRDLIKKKARSNCILRMILKFESVDKHLWKSETRSLDPSCVHKETFYAAIYYSKLILHYS